MKRFGIWRSHGKCYLSLGFKLLWTLHIPTVVIIYGIWYLTGCLRRILTQNGVRSIGRSRGILDGTKSGEAVSINAMATLRLTDLLQQLLGSEKTKATLPSNNRLLQEELVGISQSLTELHSLYVGLSSKILTSDEVREMIDLKFKGAASNSKSESGKHFSSFSTHTNITPKESKIRPILSFSIANDFAILPLSSFILDQIMLNRGKLKASQGDSSDMESVKLFPIIHTKPVSDKPHRKTINAVDQTPVTEELRQSLRSSQTIGQLKEQIKVQETEIRKQKQALQKLTPDEYSLSREDLMAKWAKEDRARKYGELLYVELTEEEKHMTKSELRRKWVREARTAWVERQRQLGREVIICDICNSQTVVGDPYHRCFVAFHQKIDRRGGMPRQKEVLVSQNKTGAVQIRHQTAINLDEYRKTLEASQKLFEKLTQIQEKVGGVATEDVQMATEAAGKAKRTRDPIPQDITKVQVVEDNDSDIDIETVQENFRIAPDMGAQPDL